MFPIYILRTPDDVAKLPKRGTYYILARNGFYIHRDMGLIVGTVKVNQMSFLEPIEPWAEFFVPLIPEDITRQTVAFFRAVYRKMKTEAAVLLHYNEATNEFCLTCPEQEVSGASVAYDSSDRIDEFLLVGSLHSHCGFSAFHSGGDRNDEEAFDGLHITIGNNDSDQFSVVSSLVINGNRFVRAPESVLGGIRLVNKVKPKTAEVNDALTPLSPLFAIDQEEPSPVEEPKKGAVARFIDSLDLAGGLGSLGNMGAPGFFTLSLSDGDADSYPHKAGVKSGGYTSKPSYELTTPMTREEEQEFFPKSWLSHLHHWRFSSKDLGGKNPDASSPDGKKQNDSASARTWDQGGDS